MPREPLMPWTGAAPTEVVRELLVKLLLVCSVRSECLLDFFTNEEIDVSTPACAGALYAEVLRYNGTVFPGYRPGKARKVHTTEQLTFGMGKLIEAILVPYWKDPTVYDHVLCEPAGLKNP
ncbi:unnamed protein product [Prorocentrum cordatum]|uniref:Uncharacterized protein n=1 Tax=Prorocentrum cordatum TaxID=2364126 RepID=A0ABN9TYA9_9DINO|nr:unnamed protein product [Polarella glacialis]